MNSSSTRARELRSFETLQPVDPPPSFNGELRSLSARWPGMASFSPRFGFGGCLADDMGLGKTVQALALLEERRLAKAGPSLVVVPRSLLFNWRLEALRFTPAMRVLVHEGRDRARDVASFADHDLVLVTYGTLRRDAAVLAKSEFDYVILDEAQAIKNASHGNREGGAAAPRQASPGDERHAGREPHRRPLEPVRVSESAACSAPPRVLQRRYGTGEPGESGRSLIARAVRPFILRRTKEQVAPELPREAGADDLRGARAEASASATTSCATIIVRRCSGTWTARGSRSRRSRFSRRCSGCVRRRVIRG